MKFVKFVVLVLGMLFLTQGTASAQVKAPALSVNPHASITSSACGSDGSVIQRNKAQSGAAQSPTGRALMSASDMQS